MKVTVKGKFYISEGGLSGKRMLEQFHFHWGRNGQNGAEHTIDSEQEVMEVSEDWGGGVCVC